MNLRIRSGIKVTRRKSDIHRFDCCGCTKIFLTLSTISALFSSYCARMYLIKLHMINRGDRCQSKIDGINPLEKPVLLSYSTLIL